MALLVLKGPFKTPKFTTQKIKSATFDQTLFSIYKYSRNIHYTSQVLFLYEISTCKSSSQISLFALFYNFLKLRVIYSVNTVSPPGSVPHQKWCWTICFNFYIAKSKIASFNQFIFINNENMIF